MAPTHSGQSSPGPQLIWDPSEETAHKVQFYHDDSFLLDQLDQFIAPVIASGNSVILIVNRVHRDALYDRLRARGTEFALAVGQERFLLLDAEETLEKILVNGMPDTARFDRTVGGRLARLTAAAKSADRRVVAFGEMVACLWGRGQREAALRLEQLWNRLAAAHSFQLLCAYPARYFFRQSDRDELFMKVCAEHTHVYPAESTKRVQSVGTQPFLLRQQSGQSQMQPPADPEAEFNALFGDAGGRLDWASAKQLAGPVKTALNALEHARQQVDVPEETRQSLTFAGRALQQVNRMVQQALDAEAVRLQPPAAG